MIHQVIRSLILLSIAQSIESFQCRYKFESRTSTHLLQMQQTTRGNDDASERRTPSNKRQAIRWVIQGVERCLAEQQLPSVPENSSIRFRKKNDERIYTYKRREDARQVQYLFCATNNRTII